MNKASGGDGIPVELLQILKDGAVKVLHSICQQIWKTEQWPQDWKGQFLFQSQRKAIPKNVQTTAQLHSSLLLLLLSRFSCVQLCVTPQTAAHHAPPSLGFSRQEHWRGLPFPSPMHESEKWKWSFIYFLFFEKAASNLFRYKLLWYVILVYNIKEHTHYEISWIRFACNSLNFRVWLLNSNSQFSISKFFIQYWTQCH